MTQRKKTYRTARVLKLPRFDPGPSAAAGAALLKKAGVPFALAGRVAMWMYLPADKQAYTKDVDFAVPRSGRVEILAAARKAGHRVHALDIGGCALRGRNLAVDFIDRDPVLGELFGAAVEAAQRSSRRVRVGRVSIPIVPRDYLIAMKIATMEDKDERDAEWLIQAVPDDDYASLRSIVRKFLGDVLALRLDALARKVGHPGPGRKKY